MQAQSTMQNWWEQCHQDKSVRWLTGSNGPIEWQRMGVMEYLKPGTKVLNIGVGLGHCTKRLVDLGMETYALDISQHALDRVAPLVKGAWRADQLAQLPEQQFNLAISHLVAQHMGHEDVFHQFVAVIKALRSDGVFCVQFASHPQIRCNLDTEEARRKGEVFRTLPQMKELVELAGGRVLKVVAGGFFPDFGFGHYTLHIGKGTQAAGTYRLPAVDPVQDFPYQQCDAMALQAAQNSRGLWFRFKRMINKILGRV